MDSRDTSVSLDGVPLASYASFKLFLASSPAPVRDLGTQQRDHATLLASLSLQTHTCLFPK